MNDYLKHELNKRVEILIAESEQKKDYIDNYCNEHLEQIKSQAARMKKRSTNEAFASWKKSEIGKFTSKLADLEFKLYNKIDVTYNLNAIILIRSWQNIINFYRHGANFPSLRTYAFMLLKVRPYDNHPISDLKGVEDIAKFYGVASSGLNTRYCELKGKKPSELNKLSNKKHKDWVESNYEFLCKHFNWVK